MQSGSEGANASALNCTEGLGLEQHPRMKSEQYPRESRVSSIVLGEATLVKELVCDNEDIASCYEPPQAHGEQEAQPLEVDLLVQSPKLASLQQTCS